MSSYTKLVMIPMKRIQCTKVHVKISVENEYIRIV